MSDCWGSWRKERHRAILRKKIQASQKTDACLLRGADFSFVLDHLWHGAGSGGSPVTWGDYVNSRCLVLPIPAEV
ncbi:Fungal specific transcription factor domain [Rhizoctonia solani]|uniref:Fungal specific transcription factor domain n=1 Tax=Rhizoctonia solani TaxID=456999 RepID=A0A8H8T149_9AGAM|nr:Fungal specific transcription factor domain [Rhizoctonia solani]QRW24999.1 Fungal specific transcription factor domain [Rhizoctonia solani]